jgi:hypothetical protein
MVGMAHGSARAAAGAIEAKCIFDTRHDLPLLAALRWRDVAKLGNVARAAVYWSATPRWRKKIGRCRLGGVIPNHAAGRSFGQNRNGRTDDRSHAAGGFDGAMLPLRARDLPLSRSCGPVPPRVPESALLHAAHKALSITTVELLGDADQLICIVTRGGDETLTCGASIHAVGRAGAEVEVICLTQTAPAPQADPRQEETAQAVLPWSNITATP